MLTYRTGAAGTAAAAKAMAAHFLSPTLPPPQAALAAYYQNGSETDTGVYASTTPYINPDIDPRLNELLGLPSDRPLSMSEVANLFAGGRADGAPVHGKQAGGRSVSLAQELGLNPSRFPSFEEVERVLRGHRADNDIALPADRVFVLQQRLLALFGYRKPLGGDTSGCVTTISSGKREDGSSVNRQHFLDAINQSHSRIAFVDFCWSADKSVSLAWAMAPTEGERNLIAGAHRRAVASAMLQVETTIGVARRGKGGLAGVDVGATARISFDHYTSRPTKRNETIISGDPNLHTHAIVLATVLTENGRVGSPDLRIKGKIREWGHLYQAYLATNLRALGVEVSLDLATGAARIDKVPDYVRVAFSKRTQVGVAAGIAYAEELGLDWNALSDEQKVGFRKTGVQGDPRQSKKDDQSDWTSWRLQAAKLRWQPESVIHPERPFQLASRETRLEIAYEAALDVLEKALPKQAVIEGGVFRSAAAAGLVASGIENAAEIDLVEAMIFERGVRQDGEITAVIRGTSLGSHGREVTQATTALHADREAEMLKLAREASCDMTAALTAEEVSYAVQATGIDFTSSTHGRAQKSTMERLAFGGRLSVAIGVAGSGKSALLTPLIYGWKRRGCSVWGTAVAWRQSADFAAAGVVHENCLALSVFLDRVRSGVLKVDKDSVLVIDELGTVGTKQLLDVLRLQKAHKFRVVAVGDPRQCQSIEAGPVIDILRKSLGARVIPEILTTVRQTSERERLMGLLFRQGRAAEALDMKRDDGTARLSAGTYDNVVEDVALLWKQRTLENKLSAAWTITVSAPTNSDARAISSVIRKHRQLMGDVGRDKWHVSACDLRGDCFGLTLAVGDRVRLFKRTNARCKDRSRGLLGNNGTVLEVVGVTGAGITLRNSQGRVGEVAWETLRCPATGRILLSYGDVHTIDSAQGLTSSEHIVALPNGTSSVNGFKAYTAGSRHRSKMFMIVSDGAERREILGRRPLGDPRRVTVSDVWANVARNLSRQPESESALAFLQRTCRVRQEASIVMQVGFHKLEQFKNDKKPVPLNANLKKMRFIYGLAPVARQLFRSTNHLTRILSLLKNVSIFSEADNSRVGTVGPRQFEPESMPKYRM